jgi:hypothetical protein
VQDDGVVQDEGRRLATKFCLMDSRELERLADELGLDLAGDSPTRDSLKRAIERELQPLQISVAPDEKERYRVLMDAHARVAADPLASTELVTITSGALERLLQAVRPESSPGAVPGSIPVREMRRSSVAASTRATSDFRKERTLPLVGIGAVVVVLWGTRAAFDINIRVDPSTWGVVCLAIVLACAGLLLLARRNQQLDESSLRRLYDPDWQEEALLDVAGVPRRYLENQVLADGEDSEPMLFSRTQYKQALGVLTGNKMGRRGPRGYESSDDRVVFGRLLSTVDLESAVDDAADLALQRFFELEQVHAQIVRGRQYLALGPAMDASRE